MTVIIMFTHIYLQLALDLLGLHPTSELELVDLSFCGAATLPV